MFTKKQGQDLLKLGLSTGADYCEFFIETTKKYSISAKGQDVRNASISVISGVGVRLMQGEKEVYGSTSDINYDDVYKLTDQLKNSFTGKANKPLPFKDELTFKPKSELKIVDVSGEEKKEFLLSINKRLMAIDKLIIDANSSINQSEQSVLIINSNGVYQHDFRPYIRLMYSALAKNDEALESNYKLYSAQKGYEYIRSLNNLDADIKDCGEIAVQLLTAEKIKAGKMTVVLDNGFGGVIFHEACGHPLEASAISRGLSPFCGKVGEQIASTCVSAYDDGTIEGAWGQINIDDEGNMPTRNLLIENGILKGYMVDRKCGIMMNAPATGCARRQDYSFIPTSRMTSTFIAPGKNKKEDLFKDVKFGLYVKSLSGGQVSPATGEFNFGCQTAYYIRDGKICELVKGAMLIGYGHEILKQIDMVADNCELGEGMCGAASGNIPVDVGQPTIRVQNLLVGGDK